MHGSAFVQKHYVGQELDRTNNYTAIVSHLLLLIYY
jgi:hypothetical protein